MADEMFLERHRNGDVVFQQVPRVEVYEHFQGCQGSGLRNVHNGNTLGIPAAAVTPCTLTGEGCSPAARQESSSEVVTKLGQIYRIHG